MVGGSGSNIITNKLKVFYHYFQLSESYFGAFKNKAAFIRAAMHRGKINFRIENHIINSDDKNDCFDLRADMYKYAMEHPNKVFETPIRARDGFHPELWAE